jgi:DNA-binding NarL/FixJ family response regulator
VIYDQFPLVRDSLCALLDALPDIDVVATADNVRHATELIRRHRPGVVLIGGATLRSCVDLIRAVKGERPEPVGVPYCLVFYQELTYGVMAELLRAGAKGLLNRDADRDQVVSATRAVAQGNTVLTYDVAYQLVEWFRRHATDTAGLETRLLTEREREVLILIGRGLSIGNLAEALHISVSTVRTHLHRIRHKLDLRDRAQLVAFAYRCGLVREAA